MPDTAAAAPRHELDRGSEGTRLALHGSLRLRTVGALWRTLLRELDRGLSADVLDLGGVTDVDTAGATLILELTERLGRPAVIGANDGVAALLSLLDRPGPPEEEADEPETQRGAVLLIGEFALQVLRNVRSTIEYVGHLTHWLAVAVFRPSRIRWNDVGLYMARSGADALGIVALISLLVGVIVAFQAAAQLSKFGADLYVADSVGMAILMELGPLMTAVIVAGRSGAAFAAEIGTMKVNEEVDALTTMGLDRMRVLVLPKVLALLLVMPLLVVFADFCGVLGGLFIGVVSVEMPIPTYLARTQEAVTLWHAAQGLIKGECYALVISAVGCLRGLQTQRGAQGVGLATTSAVVTAIFLIVIVDAVLTVIYHYVG